MRSIRFVFIAITLALATHSVSANYLVWSVSTGDKVQRSDMDGSNVTDLTPDLQQNPYGTSGGPWGVATDSSTVYFTQDNDSRLYSVGSDGTNLSELGNSISGVGNARDIHVANNQLYWGTWSGDLQTSGLDGSGVTTLSSGNGFMQGIFASDDYIYWTNSSSSGKSITRSDLDGGNKTDLVTTDLSIPYGIWATDSSLYWVDLGLGTLSTSDLLGNNISTVMTSLTNPSGLTIYDDQFYYTEKNGGIWSANLDGSNRTQLVSDPRDVRFIDVVRTSTTGTGGNGSASIPEPATLTIMSLGLVGLGFARRRRSQA